MDLSRCSAGWAASIRHASTARTHVGVAAAGRFAVVGCLWAVFGSRHGGAHPCWCTSGVELGERVPALCRCPNPCHLAVGLHKHPSAHPHPILVSGCRLWAVAPRGGDVAVRRISADAACAGWARLGECLGECLCTIPQRDGRVWASGCTQSRCTRSPSCTPRVHQHGWTPHAENQAVHSQPTQGQPQLAPQTRAADGPARLRRALSDGSGGDRMATGEVAFMHSSHRQPDLPTPFAAFCCARGVWLALSLREGELSCVSSSRLRLTQTGVWLAPKQPGCPRLSHTRESTPVQSARGREETMGECGAATDEWGLLGTVLWWRARPVEGRVVCTRVTQAVTIGSSDGRVLPQRDPLCATTRLASSPPMASMVLAGAALKTKSHSKGQRTERYARRWSYVCHPRNKRCWSR